jgi:hypothetical protein
MIRSSFFASRQSKLERQSMRRKKNELPSIAAALVSLLLATSISSAQSSKSQPHAATPARGPIVTAIRLLPIKTRKGEPCPAMFSVLGELETNGATSVNYTWVSSDGHSWPNHTLVFATATSQSLAANWSLGGPGANTDNWIQLSVLSPNKRISKKLKIGLACAK